MYDLFDRHEETLDKICDFLGVSPFKTYPKDRYVQPHYERDLDRTSIRDEDIEFLHSSTDIQARHAKNQGADGN